MYALLTEIIILSQFFLNHHYSYIAVHFIEMFLVMCLVMCLVALVCLYGGYVFSYMFGYVMGKERSTAHIHNRIIQNQTPLPCAFQKLP